MVLWTARPTYEFRAPNSAQCIIKCARLIFSTQNTHNALTDAGIMYDNMFACMYICTAQSWDEHYIVVGLGGEKGKALLRVYICKQLYISFSGSC